MATDVVLADVRLPDSKEEEAELLAAAGDDLLKLFVLNYEAKRSSLGWRHEDDDWLWL